MYRLTYHNTRKGETLIETVLFSAPLNVCKWKKKQIENTTHVIGKLKITKL